MNALSVLRIFSVWKFFFLTRLNYLICAKLHLRDVYFAKNIKLSVALAHMFNVVKQDI